MEEKDLEKSGEIIPENAEENTASQEKKDSPDAASDGGNVPNEDVPSEREQALENKLFCIQNGVPEENCDVVIAAASVMGKSDRKAAIAEVLEKFPFFKPVREERGGITTGVHIEGVQGSVLSGVEEAFFAANPDCR